MTMLEITAGGFTFKARYEEDSAPKTVAAFKKHLLGLTSKIIHVRWSGQAGWIPFGDLDLGLGAGERHLLSPPRRDRHLPRRGVRD